METTLAQRVPYEATRRYVPFVLWLGVFYTAWLALVGLGGHWAALQTHWPIALAMTFGSYIAGSTPMGGGTVGFPVLVLLFDQDPALGRDFSFAVQSIGMTSAAVFILCSGRALAWRILRWAMLGALIGTPLGLVFIAPLVPSTAVKLLFAVVWASFGLMTFVKLGEIASRQGILTTSERFDRISGFLVGLVGGGFVASLTGVGMDMLIYTLLVLLFRADLRIAIPTSVILMAFGSVVGLACRAVQGDMSPEVFSNWLAAAPVVALGAPLGALVVGWVGRVPTLTLVAALCLFQFAWTCYQEWPAMGTWGLVAAIAGLATFNLVFHLTHRAGEALAVRYGSSA